MLEWSEELRVGIAELDDQHRHLFSLAGQIVTAADGNRSAAALRHLLGGVMNYGLYHMSTEEEYMHQFACPDEVHVAHHHAFREETRQRYEDICAKFDDGAIPHDALKSFAVFVAHWHYEHIRHADMKYTACFHEHGL